MYTIPEAERNKAKRKHLNTKYPDEWAATRLVRVIVSVRMRPNIYGSASTRCTRLVNPTLQYEGVEESEEERDSGDEGSQKSDSGEMNIIDLQRSKTEKDQDRRSNAVPSVVVQTRRQKMNGSPEKTYTFDHVFSPSASQAHVYRTIANPLVDNIMSGVNACVIAYGQTGAGKTYTVFGPSMDAARVTAENATELGVILRAAHDIFERIDMDKGKYNYKVYVTYMQIYLDQIYDLISHTGKPHGGGASRSASSHKQRRYMKTTRSTRKKNMNMSMSTHNKLDQENGVRSDTSTRTPKAQRPGTGNLATSQQQREQGCLKIREHHGVPYVAGLSVHRVTSALDILELLHEGSRNKIVASTAMNEASSRSHAIFQVMVEKRGGGLGRRQEDKRKVVDRKANLR